MATKRKSWTVLQDFHLTQVSNETREVLDANLTTGQVLQEGEVYEAGKYIPKSVATELVAYGIMAEDEE